MKKNNDGISRRQFLLGSLAVVTAPYVVGCQKTERKIEGIFVNDSVNFGHKIRDGAVFGVPLETVKTHTVIVGGGIAGLSAAWELERKGFKDFTLLELEKEVGGNSRYGKNEITAYPWAAHYIPVPNKNSDIERELFEELGLIKTDGGWDERHICRQPQERLFINGEWQEGLHPLVGASARDLDDHKQFYHFIDEMRDSGDFTIAAERGGKLAELDKISMAEWLKENGLNSKYLWWYVDYACRDDYGSNVENTSAWAGIHYFACREDTEDRVFTWPEGNGWIVRKLASKLSTFLKAGKPVYRIARDGKKINVFTESVKYVCGNVIFAAPTFLAPYIVEGIPRLTADIWSYSPWLTANIVLERQPKAGRGAGLAWDNVIFDSPNLGYVVANHQAGYDNTDRLVWTLYWPLSSGGLRENRRLLLEKDWHYWKEAILKDLEKAHPDIRRCVSRIDIMRMGHAMARPAVGTIFHEEKRLMTSEQNGIFFANGDLAGFSIFEESQYHGVRSAREVLKKLGK